MRVFMYRGDASVQRTRLGIRQYPSGIGWYVILPGRRFLAIQIRKPR